ncbi:MAG: nucleotidyltransferase family protein [Oscillospiraceae bacterium]|nr:nucleotidyltransferase family protein [Oscillospiraceae bacterium]
MLTTKQTAFLALIRSVLWGAECPENAETTVDEAKTQALVPLLFPDRPETMHQSAHYIRVLYTQDEVIDHMQAAGIPVAVLKGAAAAIYYRDPIRRTMGDIDLIVPQSDFTTARKLMEQSGYQWNDEDTQNTDIREIAYQRDGITVELHRRFSSEGIDVEKYIIRGLKAPVTAQLDDHVFPMLPSLENGLVLLAHVAQHLREGLGLRQMIDWMMYVHACLTDEFWRDKFQLAAADCKLETLAVTATRLCQKHLGLPDPITWCSRADESLVDDLLENLLVTGNFGHVHGSGSSVETVATNIKRTGLLRYLQQQGEHNWKAYQRHRILKPFCWLYQIFRYVRRGLKTGRSGAQLAKDYKRSQTRYDLLKQLGLD